VTPRGTLFAALFAVSAIAAAQGTIDFRGVPLGASEAEFRAQLRGFQCRAVPAGGEQVADRICVPEDYPEERKFGGAATTTLFAAFASDRFVGMLAVFDTRDFEKVREALAEKFGRPISTDHPEFLTRGGLRTANEVVTWRRGSGVVIARRYGNTINEATVQYADEAGIATLQPRAKEAAKKNAKSL